MDQKKILPIAVVLVLAALFLTQDKGVKRSRDGLVFASLSPEAVDTILLQRGEQEILLKKMDQGAWVVDSLQGFEAQQERSRI